MRKGNQVKIVGAHPYCGNDGIVKYHWYRMWRGLTEEELQEWYDSDASKGITSAGESKLPPTCKLVKYNGGTIHRPDLTISPDEHKKLSDDTFTIVRSRCAPILFHKKMPGMTLLRNNRTGEEGYIKRKFVECVQAHVK